MAPDIMRQLPAESKMFLKVDTSWKEIMAKVNKMPNALNAATQPGRYSCSIDGKLDKKTRICVERPTVALTLVHIFHFTQICWRNFRTIMPF